MVRLVTITTHGMSTNGLLRGQLAYLREQGFDVVAIASPGPELEMAANREQVRTVGVPIEREIHPLRDLGSLVRLYRTLRNLRPDIVNAGTAKAGLLGMMAGWAARVPVRIYTLRGLRCETTHGVKRWVLKLTERIASVCATRIVCVSASVRDAFLAAGLAPAAKTVVLGSGSSNGVDVDRFLPRAETEQIGRQLRAKYDIADDEVVIGYVGRFVRDKGIVDLLAALQSIVEGHPRTRLLLVGDFEDGDPLTDEIRHQLRNDPRIVVTGWVVDVAPYYALMDVLALPSYREGFPNAPLEAAAAELPVVGFRATGTVDAIEDGVTGALVPVGDIAALATALARYVADAELRREHGAAGRQRVLGDFRQELVWERLQQEYLRLLGNKSIPAPAVAAQAPVRVS